MGRRSGIVLIICLVLSLFTGCYDSREIDDLTYIIALGLDKGAIEPLRLTLQYAIPKEMGGGGGGGEGGGKGGSKSIGSITIECPTLYAGLNMANGFIGKKVNASHAVAIVISEELAKEGVRKYIHAAERGREFRPNMYIVVSNSSAEEYLKQIKPVQEVDPVKYYQLIFTAYQYTGFTPNSSYYHFYQGMTSDSEQPVAILAGVGKYKSSKEFANIEAGTASDKGRTPPLGGDFKAGNLPKIGDQNSEVMGLAVFNGDKFVGEMDGEDSTNFIILKGYFKHAYLTIPDPEVPGYFIVLDIKQNRFPEKKVKIVGDTPQIYTRIKLEADLVSIQSGYNYEDPRNLFIVENAASAFLKEEITKFLYRTAKDFNSDIVGFGKLAARNFLTTKQWEDYRWLDKYKNSNFNVDVEVMIRRPGLIIRTSPVVTSRNGEVGK